MTSDRELAPDIAILLAQTWGASTSELIDFEVICRIWAYDLGWFDIETSTRVRDNIIEAGWIQIEGAGLKPGFNLEGVEVPLSWMPAMRVLDNPPIFSVHPIDDVAMKEIENTVETIVESGYTTESRDPAATHIVALLDKISQMSGIEKKEIMRRAQRKRNALGPVTLWMVILLVAREQRINMPELLQLIAPV